MPLLRHATRLASYRTNSEDRALVLDLDDRLVIIVADGAGGIVGGGAAADVVVGLVRERAAELTDVGACVELLKEADAQVVKTGGETTAVLVVAYNGGLYGASSGDSEAWLVREDGTVDDLTEHQHLKRRLGSSRGALPVGFERGGLEGGTLVVGSDGLFRYARRDAIAEFVTTAAIPEDAAEGLVELVRTRSGDLLDDVGVVVVKPIW